MTAANLDAVGSQTASAPSALIQEQDGRLPLRTKIGFGIGDFAFNLYWQATTMYLLYYYTDVVGLSPATAGWIFGGAMLWDALCDPVAGYIANRTRTRWGRYRPYLLFGCVPLAASFVAMFFPTGAMGTGLLAFVMGTHMLFRTTYTVLSMPYNALMATLTNDSRERGSLAAYRMVCASTAGLVVALSTLKLVHIFGPADEKQGFLVVMTLYAVVSLPVFLLTFFSTRERVQPDAHAPSVRDALAVVLRNRAFLLVCGMGVALSAAGTFLSKTLPYVLKYALHREDLIGLALGVVALQVFIAIPFWAWVMRRTSKRLVALTGGCLGIGTYALLGGLGTPSVSVFLLLLGVIGFASAATLLAMWAMIPDTVEYGEWRTGIRGEGTIFGVIAFAQKGALAIAVGGVGHSLGAVGFIANQAQAQAAIDGMWAMLWQGPMVLLAIGVLFAFFYPISPGAHRGILSDLRQRRTASGTSI
ncbi:MFS transporter [Cupriavidus sp. D39]|uniref:MFS transporter n=1 Tax=Cupriavidus sp. D39 TaxID=2997877 RepID=UPI00226E12D0|nr:glycoside-pentoside-hexuronide (GPH):cation symporter [Cupriavidus sp. D39]MCY0854095.1 glycoside-pentoside-hexuronide (GPH):cation symporter [Cupriavidus sp. D39]